VGVSACHILPSSFPTAPAFAFDHGRPKPVGRFLSISVASARFSFENAKNGFEGPAGALRF